MRHPHETNDFQHRPAATPRTPALPLRDTAGWQALYQDMLSHITGNVEHWLKNYLSELIGQEVQVPAAPAPVRNAPAASSANAGTTIKFVIPPWLEPLQDPGKVRFTRTPDHILQREKDSWPDASAEQVEDLTAEAAGPVHVVEVPLDRRPFVPAPGVRYTRTPDRLLHKAEALAAQDLPEIIEGTVVPTEISPETVAAAPGPEQPYATWSEQLVAAPVEAAVEVVNAAAPDVAQLASEQTMAGSDLEDVAAVAPTQPLVDMIPPEDDAPVALPGAAAENDLFADVPPQPWGAFIQLGPLESPAAAIEQDLETILGFEREAVAEALAAERAVEQDVTVPTAEIETEVQGEDPPIQAAVPPAEPVEESAEAEVQAAVEAEIPLAEVTAEADASAANEAVEDAVAEVPVAEEAPVAAAAAVPEPIRAAAMPGNALHMAFLGGLNDAVRRPRFNGSYEHPPLELLSEAARQTNTAITRDALEQHARLLEGVLEDFGIRGEIINVRPGPVVTLYELEPAPGIKSSRVVGLADDIARSMSAVSARVAVVQGRNAIGIELPNQFRDLVYLRELFAQPDFAESKHKLAIALGKTIGGEPVIVDLARMPHLLVAGTTGSGKSVAINTMILSLLYRLKPEECRLIMVDPKMLELSIYDGIPHLLTPVVTDPKKAVIALKWAVREMEDRYKKMAKIGVRNIDGFNARVTEAKEKGEKIVRTVHTGFDRATGEATYAAEEMDLSTLPYIVVIVDEMADLMMVAGKDIEGAIQRLAQMARAAGIHLIMATQRPSVDVITGTIKANFPTRISFQVTSKIDSRTILGEQGAEQLLGQGDMLHMMGGGRIARVHGPFVSDNEVEVVVNHLKAQGKPDYLDVTAEEGEGPVESAAAASDEGGGDDGAVFDKSAMGSIDDSDLYDQAVKIVLRDKKCSTSYIQRRLSVGYNKAASLVEKMEKEGIVGPANHAGKREILIYSRDMRSINISMPDDDDIG